VRGFTVKSMKVMKGGTVFRIFMLFVLFMVDFPEADTEGLP